MIKPSEHTKLITYPIRDIMSEARKYKRKMVYLNIGDPAPYGFYPPKHIKDAIKEALEKNYTGYAPSEGDPELREEIAEYEKVGVEDVFVTAGLSEGIDFLFNALLNRNEHILLPLPTYPLYLTKQRIYGGQMRFYEHDERYEPDIEDMRKKITKNTKAILVINPNNPTGKVYSRKVVREIVNVAGEYGLPIISDDAYEHVVFSEEYINLREVVKDVPLISGNSMSKNYLYPGARVGYLAFRGEGWEGVKDAILRMCNQRLSVNWEMQKGYVAARRGGFAHLKPFERHVKRNIKTVMEWCKESETLYTVRPEGAFYAFVKVKSRRWKDDWEFTREMIKNGVVVVPGSAFGPVKGLYFRMTLLPQKEQIEEVLEKIEQVA